MTLSQALDQLNDEIRNTEEWIRSLGLGAAASTKLECGGYLMFTKFNGTWHLGYTNDGEEMILTSASIEIRLEASKKIPQLVTALRESSSRITREAEEASCRLRNWRVVEKSGL